LVLLLLAACADEPEPFDGPCPALAGVWLMSWHERPNGTCDSGDFETTVVFGGAPRMSDLECTGSVAPSADGCAITYDNFRCVQPNGLAATMTGIQRFVADDELRGVITMRYETDFPCTATYDATLTRQ
jgi:hypothetical protein